MQITSAKQLLENCRWINLNLLVFDLYSKMLDKSLPVELAFDSQKAEKQIYANTIKSIIEFQHLKASDLTRIHDTMWNFVTKWRSESERTHMGTSTKRDAIRKSSISGVGFINEKDLNHTFFSTFLSVDWDIEHGVTISYYNGNLADVQ